MTSEDGVKKRILLWRCSGYTAVEEANESNGWIDIVDIWDDQSMPVWRAVFGVLLGGKNKLRCLLSIANS